MTAAVVESDRSWSDQQSNIFEWCERGSGNLLVRARAGTGKSTTIIEGVQRMPEEKVLLAAFNKDIAKELQGRVGGSTRVEAKTLHSLGFAYVRRNWRVRIDENGERAMQLAKQAAPDAPWPVQRNIRDLHSKAREIAPHVAASGALRVLASLAARFDLLPDEEWESQGWGAREVCSAALQAMRLATERTDVIDFSDMIFLPLHHRWVRPWYAAVVVDEAQDMTEAQLAIAVGSCFGRVCVVGDDRQAIYGFRGADVDSLDRLKFELQATELGLTTTYRCPKKVVALAARIVPDYVAADSAPDGEVTSCSEEKMIEQANEGDFIVSRKNAPLVRTCLGILKRGVRARIKGRDIGKGVIALIGRLKASSVDELRDKLDAWVAAERVRARKLPDEAFEERMGIVNDQRELVLALADDCDTLEALRVRCEEMFTEKPGASAVTLSTVHRVKGLEADTVYILRDTFRDLAAVEGEESNILYVAITRAKRKLVWVSSQPPSSLVQTTAAGTIGLDVAIKHHGEEAAVAALVPTDLIGRPTNSGGGERG
jgi:DNA helicase-2/ATP-dependent DNA helicase PcrA